MIGRLLLILLGFFWLPFLTVAQDSAPLTSSNPTPLIGEPFQLTIRVNLPSNAVVTWPSLIGRWDSIEVLNASDLEQAVLGEITQYQQVLEVVAWKTGIIRTPQWAIPYASNDDTSPAELIITPLTITVPSVLGEEENAGVLRPAKPLIESAYFPYKIVISIGAGLLAVVVMHWYWRYRQKRTVIEREERLSAASISLSRLEALRLTPESSIEIYSGIADCLRRYVADRFSVQIEDVTSDELVKLLILRSEGDVTRLRKLLEYVDLVKFAQVVPTAETTTNVIKSAERWIVDIEQQHING